MLAVQNDPSTAQPAVHWPTDGTYGVRKLPRQVRPMANETVDSFLWRLESANGVHGELRSLCQSQFVASTIARLTGRPLRSLFRVFPELRQPANCVGISRAASCKLRVLEVAAACDLCSARHCGSRTRVNLWSPAHWTVCLRRNCQDLWIGVFQATSVPVRSSPFDGGCCGVMSVGRSSSLPLWKMAPARTRATRCGAFTARQRACAASISL